MVVLNLLLDDIYNKTSINEVSWKTKKNRKIEELNRITLCFIIFYIVIKINNKYHCIIHLYYYFNLN